MQMSREITYKYTTWSIMNMLELTSNEKVALAFINAATPQGGISTGILQKYLQVATPTMHKILKSLINKNEIKRGEKMGIWVVTETEKLF